MKHPLIAGLLCAFAASATAHAAAYDDFMRGEDAERNGDIAAAVSAYDAALAMPGLAPGLAFSINTRRGAIGLNRDECDTALKHFDAALAIKQDDTVIRMRGTALRCLGRQEEALAVFDKATSTERAGYYYERGKQYWLLGRLVEAETDFASAVSANRLAPYHHLLLAAIQTSRGTSSEAGRRWYHGLPAVKDWPAPLFDLYFEHATPAQTLIKADSASAAGNNGNSSYFHILCEADFYTGIWLIARHDPAAAARIDSALSRCGKISFEYHEALILKKQLGVTP